MEFRQLTYFCKVAKTGSFSSASAELAIAQPALSRQIRKLEEELGVLLFHRNGRGVRLTEGGRRLFDRSSHILTDFENLAADAKQGSATAIITIGLPPALTSAIIAPLMRRMAVEMPNVQVRIVSGLSGHLHEWLFAKRVDIAVLYNGRISPSIIVDHIFSEYLYLVAPRAAVTNKRCAAAETISMSEMVKLSLVLPGHQHALRREVDRAASDAGVALNINFEMDAMQAIKELVLDDKARSILPFSGVYGDVKNGLIKAWRVVDPEPTNDMVLAISRDRSANGILRDVGTAIRAEISNLIQSGRMMGRINGAASRHTG